MVCRIAKPSDSITLVHIPVIFPPFGGKVGGPEGSEGGRQSVEKHAYFTLQEYDHQYRRCVRRVEHLLSVYKHAGYNLYVDKIPSFQEEMHRQLVYIQRKNYFHAQLVQRQREIRLQQAAAAPPTQLSAFVVPTPTATPPPPVAAAVAGGSPGSSRKSAGGRKSLSRVLSKVASLRALPAAATDNSLETNIAVRLFVQNQHTYHLATRVLAVARKLEASFLVLGVGAGDIVKAITAPPPAAADHWGITTRNLNFPFDTVVADNARPHEVLDSLMSARKALLRHNQRQQGQQGSWAKAAVEVEAEAGHWLEEFRRYSDQKIDLAEMVLHQYCSQSTETAAVHPASSHGNTHEGGTEHPHHRFSFLLSNCDSLK